MVDVSSVAFFNNEKWILLLSLSSLAVSPKPGMIFSSFLPLVLEHPMLGVCVLTFRWDKKPPLSWMHASAYILGSGRLWLCPVLMTCTLLLAGNCSKVTVWALASVAQWIEHWPAHWKVASLIPSQGTCLGCGPGPQLGVRERQPHIEVSLPPFPFL